MTRLALSIAALLFLSVPPALAQQPGDWVVTRRAHLYSGTDPDARVLATLPPRTVLRVVHAGEQWIEIRSTTGRANGFIRRSYAEPFGKGRRGARRFRTGVFRLHDPVILREGPDMNARQVSTIPAGAQVLVVDRSGNWYQVESQSGDRPGGWIPVISARRVHDVDRPSVRR